MSDARSDDVATWGRPYHRFRRKRKFDGATYHEQIETTIKDKGLLCRDCGKWVPWPKLSCKYELYGDKGAISRLWICECGNVLKEDVL